MALLGIKISTTTPRVPFVVENETTGAPITGLVAADIAVMVFRENDANQGVSIVTIENVSSNYGTYAGTETAAALEEKNYGHYILHLPYGLVASGSSFLTAVVRDKNDNKAFKNINICVALPQNTSADAVAVAASGGGGVIGT